MLNQEVSSVGSILQEVSLVGEGVLNASNAFVLPEERHIEFSKKMLVEIETSDHLSNPMHLSMRILLGAELMSWFMR
jgi:hypothetical protein